MYAYLRPRSSTPASCPLTPPSPNLSHHSDVKPANLLLKSNPCDHRGFTVKLADFGFVLQLKEVAEDGTRYVVLDHASGT
jgi:serine/threonine protein kinase